MNIPIKEVVGTDSDDPAAIAVVVEGDSMAPSFLPGDKVVIEPSKPPREGCAALVKLNNGTLLLRRYFSGSKVLLQADNPGVPDLHVDPSEIVFAFPVYELHRTI